MAGHEATVCDNASRAAELLRTESFDLILSDVVMPGKSGLELLEDLKKAGVKTPIILISGQANIEMAVKATKLGALDFLEKPLSTDKLLVTVENALRMSRLEEENRELRYRLGKHELVGSGPAMKKLIAQIERVAPSETLDLRNQFLHRRTGTNQLMFSQPVTQLAVFLFEARHSQRVLDGHEQLVRGERLFQKVECAELRGFHCHLNIGLP